MLVVVIIFIVYKNNTLICFFNLSGQIVAISVLVNNEEYVSDINADAALFFR